MTPQNIIIIILGIIIIIISTAFGITTAIKNNEIEKKDETIKTLTAQLGQAESSLRLQNALVEQYKIDIEKAKEQYNNDLANLNKSYQDKLNSIKSQDNRTCEETLLIIQNNQLEFLNAK